ncbi:MAG: 3-mercaptopyruvate sulfurtransferase [Pseudomonadota bacterium]
MSDPLPPLVSTAWLAEHAGTPELVVLDASWHLPAAERDPAAEYLAGHIPGARFLDLASLVDKTSPVPAALPSPNQLAERLAELGVDIGDKIVLYDDSAVKTSARAWFMLRAHGVEKVAILDGGLAKWRSEDRPLETGEPQMQRSAARELSSPKRVASKTDMLDNLATSARQVVDARGAERVFGNGTDPVHGGANGRIPGSLNVPFGQVFNEDGTYKSPDDLRAQFEAAGVNLARPVITTCGSGVTASVLLFALQLGGHEDTALYDGSWLEWSSDPETPKAAGPE